jgi:hypothetical protein
MMCRFQLSISNLWKQAGYACVAKAKDDSQKLAVLVIATSSAYLAALPAEGGLDIGRL